MAGLPSATVGIPWYSQDDWPRVREVMDDTDKIPPTYDRWLFAAEQVVKQIEREHMIPVKVAIDPDTFVAWCCSRGLDVDSGARTQYANERAREYELTVGQ